MPPRHRRTARIDAQDRGDDRVEPLRLAGIVRVRSAAVAEPEIAAARVEQAVVGRARLRRRVELDVRPSDASGCATMWATRSSSRRVPSNVFAAGFVACHSVMTLW